MASIPDHSALDSALAEGQLSMEEHRQRVATAMGGLQFARNGSYAEEVTV